MEDFNENELTKLVDEFVLGLEDKLQFRRHYTQEDIIQSVEKIKEIIVQRYNIACQVTWAKIDPGTVIMILETPSATLKTCVIPSEINELKIPHENLNKTVLSELSKNFGRV